MKANLTQCVHEALQTGTLANLPCQIYIDGHWLEANSRQTMEVFDPGAGTAFARVAAADGIDADKAVISSERAYRDIWRHVTPERRAELLRNSAALVRQHSARLAVAETLDSGKPLAESIADVTAVARFLDYYGGAADKLQGDTIPLGPNFVSYNMLEPVGVTAHIVPWNFPMFSMMRGVAPALAAGCTAVIKPAETTPHTALMLMDILTTAGIPPGVCNVVTGTGHAVGERLCQHEKVRHITFTGSVTTGSRVMQNAAKHIASVTLELGGKSPAIVLSDCDIDSTVTDLLEASYFNAGQVCSAGSRLVIERSIHDEFIERFVAHANALSIGHGLRDPIVGAINSLSQLQKIASVVDDAGARGVEVIAGGHRTTDPDTGNGWFYQPTVLDDVKVDDPVAQNEIFGPVLAVQIVDSADEALSVANSTQYGLAACIYTKDVRKALTLARDVEAGQVTVNQYYAGSVYTPFGGLKASGFGREKGMEALRNYCHIKNVTFRV